MSLEAIINSNASYKYRNSSGFGSRDYDGSPLAVAVLYSSDCGDATTADACCFRWDLSVAHDLCFTNVPLELIAVLYNTWWVREGNWWSDHTSLLWCFYVFVLIAGVLPYSVSNSLHILIIGVNVSFYWSLEQL